MTSRLYFGIAAAALAGLIWSTVGGHHTTPTLATGTTNAPPSAAFERAPSRTVTRGGASSRGGGLPSRDRSAGRRSASASRYAGSARKASVAAADPARRAPMDPA